MKNSFTSFVARLVAGLPRMASCHLVGFLTVAGFSLSAQAEEGYKADGYTQVEGTFRYGYAQEVLKYVNEERVKQGVNELVMTKELTDIAMLRAAETSVLFDHQRPNGLSCFSAFPQSWAYGENIAAGQTSPGAVMGGWMGSTGHRNNILNRSYSKIGIGCFYDGNSYYWVQAFCTADGVVEERTGEANVTVDVSLDSDLETVICRSTSKTYKVKFVANGGTGQMADQSIGVGKWGKLRKNSFKRSGYLLLGWSLTKKGNIKYVNMEPVRNIEHAGKTLKLYAFWVTRAYKIKFMSNGGSGTMPVQKMTYGKSTKLSANKFTRKGYVFKGWATSKSRANKGKVEYKNKKKVKDLGIGGLTVKLYAVWAKK